MNQPKPALGDEVEALLASLEDPPMSTAQATGAAFHRQVGARLAGHGHYAEAERCFRVALGQARADADESSVVEATFDLAGCLKHRSPRLALAHLRGVRWETVAESSRARYYNLLGASLMELCRFDLADRLLEIAAEVPQGAPTLPGRAHSLENRAQNRFELGDVEGAGRFRCEAIARLVDLDAPADLATVHCNAGLHALYLGRYEEAGRRLEESRGRATASGHLRLAALVAYGEAELELLVGDRAVAVERLRIAERTARAASVPDLQAKALVLRTLIGVDGRGALLADLEAGARDLYDRDLLWDSAILYVIAGSYAERRGGPADRLLGIARSIFHGASGLGILRDHYGRILGAVCERRRSIGEPFPAFLTGAPEVLLLKDRVQRLVDTDVRILIEGESGTGKSFLARQIHAAGGRRTAPFVIVDCTNLSESLFESKLFGHVRGAFTGAVSDATGLVEQADKGTLFLDEVGEIPTEIQAKLLYTIEERRYRPVGARGERTAEFRLIAATNRDLERMLEAGTLRRDLYYRLAGFRVRIPPLRARREDILPLVDHALASLNRRHGRHKTLRPAVWEVVVRHSWPGNVRELNATLERGYHLAQGRRIGLEDLGLDPPRDDGGDDELGWDAIRRKHLLRVLRMCRGNVSRAARVLGLNRTTLIYKLDLLAIHRSDFDPAHGPPDPGGRTDPDGSSGPPAGDRR